MEEDGTTNRYSRENNGSNFWEDSNLRQWLNSAEEIIEWKQNPPNSTNVDYNPYDTEPGFLSVGNFKSNERELIKPLQNHVLLSEKEKSRFEGGSEFHRFSIESFLTALRNYDKSYYHTVIDLVFCLSVKQLIEYVYSKKKELGEEYHKAKPTEQAVAKSNYKRSSLNKFDYFKYWLNTPRCEYESSVRDVDNMYIGNADAISGYIGVRPALTLNLSTSNVEFTGEGTLENPYLINF